MSLFSRDVSRCYRCNRYRRYHITGYGSRGSGCLPLCQRCWQRLTPAQRLPFYRQLWELWWSSAVNGDETYPYCQWESRRQRLDQLYADWTDIEVAVRAGA